MTLTVPNTRSEAIQIEKENNVMVKLNSTGKLSGIVSAYKKVCKWDGANDCWSVYFIAAKQYHTLIDDALIASISYDKMMGKIKDTYIDYAGRECKIFASEESAIDYLN